LAQLTAAITSITIGTASGGTDYILRFRLNLHPLRNCECIMATTYEAIATVEVGSGGAADIEFTSIPATYTDLVVKVSFKKPRV
jgi:hypothetical protein